MKKTALVFLVSCFFFSCEKDKQLIVGNTDIPLISKVLIGGEYHTEYSYSEANLINEEKNKFTYTKHSYDDKNLLAASEFYVDPAMFSSSSSVIESAMNRKEWVNPENTSKSLTKTYEYNDIEQLIKVTYTRPSVSNSEYSEFTWEKDRISRQTMYWQNVKSFYIDYIYDENGNLIKESRYYIPSTGAAELWTTNDYEYDNMHNPYQSFRRLMTPGKYTNPNNTTKETYTIYFDVDPFTRNVQITNNTYEYNDKGYPVKVNGEAEYVYR
jgi:hypothetical protein